MAGRTRQAKLPGTNQAPSPNHEVVRKPLLSATTLASWTTCHTRPFIQRLLERYGIDLATPAMRRGAEAHAEVQGALEAAAEPTELTIEEALAQGLFAMASEMHLIDERRRLHGYVDLLFARAGQLHILELKNSRPPHEVNPAWGAPIWGDHAVQLHVYGLIGRTSFGQDPHLHLGYLKAGSKEVLLGDLAVSNDAEAAIARLAEGSVSLPQGPNERRRILGDVHAFQRAERAPMIPSPGHDDPRVCTHCSVRAWCPNRLDQPGRYVEFDPRLLDTVSRPPYP